MMVSNSFFCSAFISSGCMTGKRVCAFAMVMPRPSARTASASLMMSSCCGGVFAAPWEGIVAPRQRRRKCRSLRPAVHFRVDAALDLVGERAAPRLPSERARALAAHAAVRAEGEIRAGAEQIDGFADG